MLEIIILALFCSLFIGGMWTGFNLKAWADKNAEQQVRWCARPISKHGRIARCPYDLVRYIFAMRDEYNRQIHVHNKYLINADIQIMKLRIRLTRKATAEMLRANPPIYRGKDANGRMAFEMTGKVVFRDDVAPELYIADAGDLVTINQDQTRLIKMFSNFSKQPPVAIPQTVDVR